MRYAVFSMTIFRKRRDVRKRAGSPPHPVSVIDLFCGAGGMTHGFVKEGFNIAAGIDNDPTCKYSYEKNNVAKFIKCDVRDIKASEINALYPKGHTRILVGCAPCQPFSGYTSKKPKGDKWSLLYNFADLIEKIQPDIVSMENVPGLLKFKTPPVFNEFIRRLKSLWRINCLSSFHSGGK